MSFRRTLYYKLANRFRPGWKALRIVMFGKYDFNDVKTWENEYVSNQDIKNLRNRVPEIVEHILQHIEPYESVLEVSAGYGNFILKVPESKKRLATEFSTQAVSVLNESGIKTIKSILPELPFEDHAVDVVVSISVFEHLKNAKTVRKSFEECHRVCKKAFILSVPFESMQPWDDLIHNHDFTKKDVLKYAKGLFELVDWTVLSDGKSKRSVSVLKKI